MVSKCCRTVRTNAPFRPLIPCDNDRARCLWPWTLLDVRFTPALTGEVVYFPYLPLNSSAHFQHVLERAKVELAPGKTWKFGAGYGAYQ